MRSFSAVLLSSVFGFSIPQWRKAVDRYAMLGDISAWPFCTFHREELFGGCDKFPVIPFCSYSRGTGEDHNQKPGQKGSKAESTEKPSVGQLLKQLESRTFSIDGQPYCSLFKIYNNEFLSRSVERGLPPLSHPHAAAFGCLGSAL